MHLAEITTLYESNSRHIPTMLRETADRIEKEKTTQRILALEVLEDGTLDIYSWGNGENSTPFEDLSNALYLMNKMKFG